MFLLLVSYKFYGRAFFWLPRDYSSQLNNTVSARMLGRCKRGTTWEGAEQERPSGHDQLVYAEVEAEVDANQLTPVEMSKYWFPYGNTSDTLRSIVEHC